MSERGSFVTQYIYCDECLNAAKSILIGNEKYLCSSQIQSWTDEGKMLPIIAGKVGGLYEGEELHDFECDYIPRLEKVICHPLRVAVLADRGEQIFIVKPSLAGEL